MNMPVLRTQRTRHFSSFYTVWVMVGEQRPLQIWTLLYNQVETCTVTLGTLNLVPGTLV